MLAAASACSAVIPHLYLLQPTTVFRNVAFISSGKLTILPRVFYNQTVTRSKYPPPQLNSSSVFNAFRMYQEFVKEVLDFYGIAGGAGQPASAVAAAAVVDLEALLSSTVNVLAWLATNVLKCAA